MGMFKKRHCQLTESSKLTDLEIGCGQVQHVPGFQAVKNVLCIWIHHPTGRTRSANGQSHLGPAVKLLSWHQRVGLASKEIFQMNIVTSIIIAALLQFGAISVLKFLIVES